MNDENKHEHPDEDQPDIEEVITDFDNGIQVRSGFEITEQEPGMLGVNIFGPIFEFMAEDGEDDESEDGQDE